MSRGRFSVARRRRAWSWLALLCAWLVIAPESSFAQQGGDAPGRACTAKDLVGSWSMQAMVVAPSEVVDRGNAWFFEHQRFVFYENGAVKHMTAN